MPESNKSSHDMHKAVLQANIDLHSRLAETYNKDEPHFRPENVEKIRKIIERLAKETNAKRLLDLGCGTGFLINIAKHYVQEIHGVDITSEMMKRIDKSGLAKITLHEHDTGSFPVEKEAFDLVTGYAFLHHLYDTKPTLQTAFSALKKGGKAYFDLDPNFYFWESVERLERHGDYDAIVSREIEMVTFKDEDIEKNFGVSPDTFNHAEYGKAYLGGFKEELLRENLLSIGFSKVEIFYHWFIGQGVLINDPEYDKPASMTYALEINKLLQKAMPLSRNLFKYIGFIATK